MTTFVVCPRRNRYSVVGSISRPCFLSGTSFPVARSASATSNSFQRGRRQTLPCQCVPETPGAAISVVYWSTGEGVSTDTVIVGARFTDRSFLLSQLGAPEYSITGDSTLLVYSPSDEPGARRFWCYVFQSDGTLNSCYTDVPISGNVLTVWK